MYKIHKTTALLLSCSLLLPTGSFAESPSTIQDTLGDSTYTVTSNPNQVNKETAKLAVENLIKIQEDIQDLRNGHVVLKNTFFDVDELPISYHFVVEGAKTDAYFIVSATDTRNPFLQQGIGEGIEFSGHTEVATGEKLYYLGLDTVVAAKDAKELKAKYAEQKIKL
ncbi:hypothetical protein NLX67_15025 [Domibacillus sp. A3M-37]|uniref:hypothetical protein n=1 Tax=Domibacillus sp. A3M-37 TaxID=2962037 RepID=UPI0020B7E364|nr:hypothetical protein [Domibacillus sp. A3M-37]MCP3763687.1 hypothetical protein [Domibacillus sp. A3M-37]